MVRVLHVKTFIDRWGMERKIRYYEWEKEPHEITAEDILKKIPDHALMKKERRTFRLEDLEE